MQKPKLTTKAEARRRVLEIGPDSIRKILMPLLPMGERRSFEQLARGVGSKTTVKHKRVVEKELMALDLFELVTVASNGVTITPLGLRFKASTTSAAAVAASFAIAEEPKRVLNALQSDRILTKSEARNRLATIGRDDELDFWIQWLAYGGIIEVAQDDITFKADAGRPIDAYSEFELETINEELYRGLASDQYAERSPSHTYSHEALKLLRTTFDATEPDKSEEPMQELVVHLFRAFGIVVQNTNGPRDGAMGLHFGPAGDDAVAFFLRPSAMRSETSMGLVLALELKRKASDKKAVQQAIGAKNKCDAYFKNRITSYAVTVSDSEAYTDKVAREYAIVGKVVHLPLAALEALAAEQFDRFKRNKPLITPVHLWSGIHEFFLTGYVEPTTSDVVKAVCRVAHK